MSNDVDPIETITKLAEVLGLSTFDLTEVAARLQNSSTVPTVAAYLPEAIEACPAKSLATYKPHFNRLADKLGNRRLDEVTEDDLIDT
ncbi:hypothetical protein BH10ACT1_BH10ACT1_28420 [soil metagenome]